MLSHYIVVIGTSAGGLSALKGLLAPLPVDFPAALFIVKHIGTRPHSLPQLLQRVCKLNVREATHNQKVEPGKVYVAPPGLHMIISNGRIQLNAGPRINYCRPAIDPLFYSAALSNGPRTIAILLSGMLDDGSAGLAAIKQCNGIAMVQDTTEAEYPDMPRNGLKNASVDYCLPTIEMADVLQGIVSTSLKGNEASICPESERIKIETEMQLSHNASEEKLNQIGVPSDFTCPICHGALWKINNKQINRYSCRVGHAFGLDSLVDGYEVSTEEALWAALRALQEKEELFKAIAEKAQRDKSGYEKNFSERAKLTEKHVKILRSILENENGFNNK
ncbi:chemotaxis protein CheB [Legionella jordanis]|uniref:protein-glutamate methylesterase n=1 Tax=Legionella jordanis TaxID=456 RepID=A0A0W0V7Z5_9GAMM|nr:chemotaxis protein CheB [Legionella jordanis]KTD16257.1 Chemotaxis response regulator protein-glutamate methylesterase [Legionella jordanis]RMX04526.1 chemotaxis protein CheB [Legionella jordanis]VEH12285.1 fused chemotaxis regulator; protein-glutamat [Legionella jordanis]